MSVQAEDLIRIAHEVLDMLGVTDYATLQLTYALKTEGKWKVSFAYEPYHRRFSGGAIRNIGSFVVDEENGGIEGMWLDRSWK